MSRRKKRRRRKRDEQLDLYGHRKDKKIRRAIARRAKLLREHAPVHERLLVRELRKLRLRVQTRIPIGPYTPPVIVHMRDGQTMVVAISGDYRDPPDEYPEPWIAIVKLRRADVEADPEAAAARVRDAVESRLRV